MRTSTVERKTRETDIRLSLSLDGGAVSSQTGIGFFDHMLTAFGAHGGFGLQAEVQGDLEVDCHHTVEDTGIVLGKAFSEALGDKGRHRPASGSFFVPMDEALAFAAVDVSGRPFLVFDASFPEERVGAFDTAWWRNSCARSPMNAGITLHVRLEYGKNSHHIAEAIFKAVAHALRLAVSPTGEGVLSTKGVL